MATMSIRLSDSDKIAADNLFKELGTTTNSAINMFLRQVIRVNGIPFEIKGNTPNKETIEAIEESIRLANDNSKGYSNIEDLKNALGV